MSVQSRSFPVSFMVTTEVPCPYLPDRMERKIITELAGTQVGEMFELLSRAGFRRSHSIAYRPACAACQACVPVRIDIAGFRPSRSMRRVLARNAGLTAEVRPAHPTQEQYQLFSQYLEMRHNDGEMVGMGPQDYASMVADSPVDTRMVEFRDRARNLIAACLTDWSSDGISAVYSFFTTDRPQNSLGTYVVLRLLDLARQAQLPYLYLGYWVDGSQKMDYKRRFRPLERYGPDGWQRIES
ncbi:arginine-tRNA-protein transferase [Dongia mobilis]|uniref:Aspartate/glutamate leucyltransferase n=1 Tax=Dongia mobilis TaxID=578943 RepID=A0A4R6WKD0_9PROT|nr:arginyltransferase [Dongia mobilis]TDQ80986.1 arginine-tRNA-protein transferase [Dongia mobilis]